MTPQPDHELVQLLKTIRYDLTALQAKVSDGLTMAARLPAPKRPSDVVCPECGLNLAGEQALAEHVFHVHDGPEPEHWKDEHEPEPEPLSAIKPEAVRRWTRWDPRQAVDDDELSERWRRP